MRALVIWTLAGIMTLAACGPPAMPLQEESTPKVVQVEASAQRTPEPTTTEEATTAEPPATSPVSPLPTPTTSGDESISSAETPATSKPAAEGQAPDRLAETMGEAVIIYRRSGGFAGVQEAWTIYPDGGIVTDDGREWQVAPEQVAQLLTDIEALGFFEMNGRYMPLDTCCDRFTYEITVRSGDRAHMAITIDAAPDAPPELWDVIGKISALLAD